MVQCAADVADYSFVWIHVAEPTSQPPTICIAVAKPTPKGPQGDDVLVLLVSMASIDSAGDFYRMQYCGS